MKGAVGLIPNPSWTWGISTLAGRILEISPVCFQDGSASHAYFEDNKSAKTSLFDDREARQIQDRQHCRPFLRGQTCISLIWTRQTLMPAQLPSSLHRGGKRHGLDSSS